MKHVKRVAILHDWLVTWRGGEKCLELIMEMFDEVEIFTLFVDEKITSNHLKNARIHTGILAYLPFVSKYYRYLLPLFPLDTKFISSSLANEHEKKPFDLVISISHCAVKNIKTPGNVPHVCYCLTPVRYIWDQYERYFSDKWYEPLVRPIRKIMQKWDSSGAKNIDSFVAISKYISDRISRYYQRSSIVVYPPVMTDVSPADDSFDNVEEEPFFLVVNALVPYKNNKLIIKAFKELPYKLKIVGSGPDKSYLESISSSNVSFLGNVTDEELKILYSRCLCLVYAAEEDFGIVPLEAQAYGKPVICFASGGCLETVVLSGENITGVGFYELTENSLKEAVSRFIKNPDLISEKDCIDNAKQFSTQNFILAFKKVLSEHLAKQENEKPFTDDLKFKVG